MCYELLQYVMSYPRVKGRTAKAIRVLERLTRAYARIKVGEQAGWKQARSCETTREGFLAGEGRL